MFLAARIGDPITHDQLIPCGVIGPGAGAGAASRVVIEGLPAATVGCMCVCSGAISAPPFVTHPPPPVPPPIVKGSTTVLIGGLPAARWTPAADMGACGVFLGDLKLVATRRVLIGG